MEATKKVTLIMPADKWTAKQRMDWLLFKAGLEDATYTDKTEKRKEIPFTKPLWHQS